MGESLQEHAEVSRVNRTRSEARSNYDRISRWYGLQAGFWESKPRELGLRQLAVQPGERVLEVGSGTGHALVAIARATGETGQAFAIDLSSQMATLARARVTRLVLDSRVTLVQGDALSLPFRPKSFDAVSMSFTLELFDTPEIPLVLAEVCRVLRGGGRIGVVAISKEAARGWITAAYDWGHVRWPTVLDCRPIYARSALERAGLVITQSTHTSIAGLGIEAVLATKAEKAGEW